MTRLKLVVKEVSEPKSFGDRGAQKLEFTCDDKKWFTYKKSLFPYIIAGAEIDADTEIKDRPHGDVTYTDRIVHEIYVDGKGVSQQSKKSYQYQDDSPENRASIEAQQAAQFTTELWIAGKLPEECDEVNALRTWLLAKLSPEKLGDASPKPEAPKEEPSFVEKVNKAIRQVDKLKRDPETVKTWTLLVKACHEDWPDQIKSSKDVERELNVGSSSEITETMPECYRRIATVMEAPKEKE